jgi:hypothetical protein
MVTTGSVSWLVGERIAIVNAVSTMSRIEIWVMPVASRTIDPASGSLKPPGPGCTSFGLLAFATAGVPPALAAHPTRSGPVNAQLPAIQSTPTVATSAASLTGSLEIRPSHRRAPSARTTAATQEATTPIIHGA